MSPAFTAGAQNDYKARLDSLFLCAEMCYQIDDYLQMLDIINEYVDIYCEYFDANNAVLGKMPKDSLDYAGFYYKMRGNYNCGRTSGGDDYAIEAELCYKRALNLFSCAESSNERHRMTLHEEVAQLYYKEKGYHAALSHLNTAYSSYSALAGQGIAEYDSLTANVLANMAMCNARIGNFSLAIQQIDEALGFFDNKSSDNYFETLRRKGKILMLQAASEGEADYKSAKECYNAYLRHQYAVIGQRLADLTSSQRQQYWLKMHKFLYDCGRLGNYASEMLYNLALFSKGYLVAYEQGADVKTVTWQQVQKNLGENDCAIEYVQYFGDQDERRIGCLVLHNNDKPQFIDLFAVDSLLSRQLYAFYTIGDAIGSSNVLLKDLLYLDKDLPSLVWTPALVNAIGSADKVFFAADGFLHQLAIEYMFPQPEKKCYRMSSTRNISKKRKNLHLDKALLCGGITYDAPVRPVSHDNDVDAYRYLSSANVEIAELPGTRREVESIYACRNNPKDLLLTEGLATDEHFMSLQKDKYNVIHLSTHGHFGGQIDVSNDIKLPASDASMSKSVVLFTGVARTLADRSFDATLNDGLLSANELSRQDFSQVELMVLSACETGAGQLTDDGVYGIQRGLKMAGAQSLILSLWSVDDQATNILMSFFYENLKNQKQKDIHAAFMEARRQLMSEEFTVFRFDPVLLTEKKENVRFDLPRYTNPFILIDAY